MGIHSSTISISTKVLHYLLQNLWGLTLPFPACKLALLTLGNTNSALCNAAEATTEETPHAAWSETRFGSRPSNHKTIQLNLKLKVKLRLRESKICISWSSQSLRRWRGVKPMFYKNLNYNFPYWRWDWVRLRLRVCLLACLFVVWSVFPW